MVWNDEIEDPFLRIASYDGQYLRVLAGPGTGKTSSIMKKLAHHLEQGVDPKKILLVTFTRVAARDLVQKVSELGIDSAENVRATTLHSYCFSMLQRQQVIQATNRTPRPLLKFELNALYQDLKHERLGGIRQLKKDVRAFESAWARLQREQPGWAQTKHDRKIENNVLSWLRFHESMLIGELVPIALQYLREDPVSPFKERFEHIIVDEYQDLNRAEQVLIDLLAENAKLTIAGDDDQSIYSFKYAHPEGIIEFNNTHVGTHDEVLAECKRCPQSVVYFARELIRKIQRYPKNLQECHDAVPGEIIPIRWNGLRKEAKGIAEIIHHFVANNGVAPGRIMVLAQRRNIASMIGEELEKKNIKVINYYNKEVLEKNIAQERYTLLCLLVNLEDRPSLRNWLAFDSTTYRVGPYATLRKYCEKNGLSPSQVLNLVDDGSIVLPNIWSLVERYRVLQKQLISMYELKGQAIVDACFPENIIECSQLRELALEAVEANMNPRDLLNVVREEIVQPEIPLERTDVSIMSLHKAKGLEADLVIIPSCVEGLIPRIDADVATLEQQQQIDENRRLFYVGITRTRNTLVISTVRFIRRGDAISMNLSFKGDGNVVELVPSRFIKELVSYLPELQTGNDFIESLKNA